jgi:hypothetical protein
MMKIDSLKPEISFEDGVPLVPNIAAVIVLQGSNYDMGYQYTQQVNQIFGSWVLENVRGRFTDADITGLKSFQWQMEKYTPEFIDIFRGMADGATAAGVKLSYEEVLADFCTEEFDTNLLTYSGKSKRKTAYQRL